jgi:hypothetical protein
MKYTTFFINTKKDIKKYKQRITKTNYRFTKYLNQPGISNHTTFNTKRKKKKIHTA